MTTEQKWPSGLPRILRGANPVCPKCTGTQFAQTEASGMDGVLKLTGLTPVRCVNCSRRYYCSTAVAVGA